MLDPFSRSRVPGDYSREGRVRLLGEAFDALMRGELPSDEARLFLAAGGMAWLRNGGDLLRDYWKIKARAGSHQTPARLWSQSSSRGATADEETGSIDPSDFKG